MANKITTEETYISNVLKLHPEIRISERLGKGNNGIAYLLENGNVLKITHDHEEYATATILKNKQLRHIINIYDCWCLKYDNEAHSNTLFAIIEEYIDTNSRIDIIRKFVSVFKHAWFSIYFSDIEPKRNATFDNLDEYMRHPQQYSNAINFTKHYIISEGEKYGLQDEFNSMYDQLAYAYLELYQNAPNSHLDLNDGNIGFTPGNDILKIFDIQ